jgi:hypothetical protein
VYGGTVGDMFRRTSRAALALAATAAVLLPATPDGATAAERAPSPRWAEITRIDGGFRYLASRYDSKLSITRSGDRVVFHDRAMRRFREALPAGCRRVAVERGIAASCRIPATATGADPLLLAIVPQAGDDRVNGSTLGAELKLSVEPGQGDDTVLGGAAGDLLNGALGIDHVTGGPGRDLIKVGAGNDIADGGTGNDRVVGGDGNDELSGSAGDDQLEGGAGNDLLLGGPGGDLMLCGPGHDTTDDNSPAEDDGVMRCEGHV